MGGVGESGVGEGESMLGVSESWAVVVGVKRFWG